MQRNKRRNRSRGLGYLGEWGENVIDGLIDGADNRLRYEAERLAQQTTDMAIDTLVQKANAEALRTQRQLGLTSDEGEEGGEAPPEQLPPGTNSPASPPSHQPQAPAKSKTPWTAIVIGGALLTGILVFAGSRRK